MKENLCRQIHLVRQAQNQRDDTSKIQSNIKAVKVINLKRHELQEYKKRVDKSYFSYNDQKNPIIPYDPSLPEGMKGNKRAQMNNRDMMQICNHVQQRGPQPAGSKDDSHSLSKAQAK